MGEGAVDWNSLAKLAREAFRDAVNDWIGKARIQGGQVRGPAAFLTPGSLVSDTNIEMVVLQNLVAGHAPPDVARVLAHELAEAWNGWAASFQAQIPGAYPTFAAFPGPVAPPTPMAPVALTQGNSVGEMALKSPMLTSKLMSALRAFGGRIQGGSPDQAIKGLADWIDASFQEWKGQARLVGIQGRGAAPNFAPPYVPVAPVLGGDNMSMGPVFAGPRFGKATF
jgi:hypothetical protein